MEKDICLKVYYLAKKDEKNHQQICGLTDGPFKSEEEAKMMAISKYRWLVSQYVIVSTQQSFQVENSQINDIKN